MRGCNITFLQAIQQIYNNTKGRVIYLNDFGYPNYYDLQNVVNNYKVETYLERINLDDECENDLNSGNGFVIIHNSNNIKKDLKEPNGIFSPKFGQTLSDINPFIDKYKCQCGFTMGRINYGTLCPICGKPVEFVDDNFSYFGWIKLKDKYTVIHPNFYKELETLIGTDNLKNIIQYVDIKDIDGFSVKNKGSKDEPYFGKGMFFFKDNYDEIISYYYSKSPNKKAKLETYMDLLQNRDKIFTHSIPVFTSLLRPHQLDGGNFAYNDVNGLYTMMVKLSVDINNDTLKMHRKKKPKLQLLFDLQTKLNKLYAEIENIMSGKKGIIRQLFGGRYNFTSRDVIMPDPNLRIDEVRLSYYALVGLLEQRIINILVKSYNMTHNDAYNMWYKSKIKIDPIVCNIIDCIIKSHPRGIPILINRNPTIAYGSILQMFVVGILENSYTMALPLQILPSMGADFDGDVLNVMLIINKDFEEEAFKVLNPGNALFISRNDGLFNNSVNHSKDTIININTLHSLCENSYTKEQMDMINAVKNKWSNSPR